MKTICCAIILVFVAAHFFEMILLKGRLNISQQTVLEMDKQVREALKMVSEASVTLAEQRNLIKTLEQQRDQTFLEWKRTTDLLDIVIAARTNLWRLEPEPEGSITNISRRL